MSASGAAGRPERTPRALSIAGSDSGGGAGIQADLKAFARCGVHGMSAITAITAQSTVGVDAIHPVPPEIVIAQIRAVARDIGIDAVKVGMLGTVEVTLAVAQALDELPHGTPVVVDPVMVAESGGRLLEADALQALIAEILPRATVLTPNLIEARELASAAGGGGTAGGGAACGGTGRDGTAGDGTAGGGTAGDVAPGSASGGDDRALLKAILALGPAAVLITGGHRQRAVDLLLQSGPDADVIEIPGERHLSTAAHGSGCTHSSVLAAQLAIGDGIPEAARVARRLAGEAVRRGLSDIGHGPGPVDVLGLPSLRLP